MHISTCISLHVSVCTHLSEFVTVQQPFREMPRSGTALGAAKSAGWSTLLCRGSGFPIPLTPTGDSDCRPVELHHLLADWHGECYNRSGKGAFTTSRIPRANDVCRYGLGSNGFALIPRTNDTELTRVQHAYLSERGPNPVFRTERILCDRLGYSWNYHRDFSE